MVCPQSNSNGAKIVVSSSCTVENSKFERTPGQYEINDDDEMIFIGDTNVTRTSHSMEGSSNKRPLKRKPKSKMNLMLELLVKTKWKKSEKSREN